MLHVPPSHTADAVPTEPSAAEQRHAARARTERQLALLDRFLEVGLEIAEAAAARAAGAPGDDPIHDPGLTYSRAARAVRLTVALQQRLAQDLAALGKGEAKARRDRVLRLVQRAIESEAEDADEVEDLCQMASERLRDDEALDELAQASLTEAVTVICRELGLPPDAWVGEFGAEAQPAAPLGAQASASTPLGDRALSPGVAPQSPRPEAGSGEEPVGGWGKEPGSG